MNTSAGTIRVGIVGAGANTRRRHLPGLQGIEGVQIVGVCNSTVESSQRVAAEFDIPRVYDDWRQAADDSDVDALVIGTRPNLHCPITLAALGNGKHVLCEARMATDAAEAEAMDNAARANPQLVSQVVPAPATLGLDAAIGDQIARGHLGQIQTIEVRDVGRRIDADAPFHWRQDSNVSGLNVMTLGIWYETVMRWVGEARRVMAMGKTFVPVRRNEHGKMRAVSMPDHLDVSAEMACGAQLHLQISSVLGMPEQSGTWICGSEATLCVREPYANLLVRRKDEAEFQSLGNAAEAGDAWKVEEDFVRAIRHEQPVRLTDFATGLRYMQFTEAVTRSLQTSQTVALPLLT